MAPEDKSDAGVSEGWKFLRNVAGFCLSFLFALPSLMIIGGAVWVSKELGLADGWALAAFFASVPVAVFAFVMLIPPLLATEVWLTKVFGVAISERKPNVLSALAVRRLSLLPRVARSLWLAAAVAIGFFGPIFGAYLGTIALGLTKGDLRGQAWPAFSVIALVLIALIWIEPKVSRAIDHWTSRWDAARRTHIESYGARPLWLHCLVHVAYVVTTILVPSLLAVVLNLLGARDVAGPLLLAIGFAALVNLYFADLLAMYVMRLVFTRR